MDRLLATIIHVTDLHLFVRSDGSQREPHERGTAIQLLERAMQHVGAGGLLSGFDVASPAALAALEELLPLLVADAVAERERMGGNAPVVVVQTGDVEAFGGLSDEPYAGFAYLQGRLWPRLRDEGADRCLDLFGNHDAWPGTFPLFRSPGAYSQVVAAIAEFAGVEPPFPRRELVRRGDGPVLELIPVSTVWSGGPFDAAAMLRGGVFASGKVSAYLPGEPLPVTQGADALAELVALERTGGALRVALVHHPPHVFDAGLAKSITNCRLVGSDRLAAALDEAGVHLVLAGHRHRLDPPRRVRRNAAELTQPPLTARTGQLVAESPTVGDAEDPAGGRRSVALYRIWLDEANRALGVDRVVHTISLTGGVAARSERNLLRGVPFP